MAKNIYDQQIAAFSQVKACAVVHGGVHVANICIKYPALGHGERPVTAFVWFLGMTPAKGVARGYGYDKTSAACRIAAEAMPEYGASDKYGNDWSAQHNLCEKFKDALIVGDGGTTWDRALRDRGFTILNVV